jgi:hypothetical protein
VDAELKKQVKEAMTRASAEDKAKLGGAVLAMVEPPQYREMFTDFLKEKPEETGNLIGELTKRVPQQSKPEVAKAALAQLTDDQRREVVQGVLGPPSGKMRDRLWVIVISALVVVMLGAVLVLSINAFIVKGAQEQTRVSPEVMLSLFTSVFGFLAGVFVPTPGQKT